MKNKGRPLLERLEMAAQSGRAGNLRSVENTCRAAIARIKELEEEVEDESRTRETMAKILTNTANALKGKPKPLHSHSWHDLPEIAEKLRDYYRGPTAPPMNNDREK